MHLPGSEAKGERAARQGHGGHQGAPLLQLSTLCRLARAWPAPENISAAACMQVGRPRLAATGRLQRATGLMQPALLSAQQRWARACSVLFAVFACVKDLPSLATLQCVAKVEALGKAEPATKLCEEAFDEKAKHNCISPAFASASLYRLACSSGSFRASHTFQLPRRTWPPSALATRSWWASS